MFPVAAELLKDTGSVMCLIKPQFEAGRAQVGKKGIVRDKKVHVEVIDKVIGYAAVNGLYPHGLDYSPVKGTKGNIEYLLYLKKTEPSEKVLPQEIVNIAHRELDC